MAEVDALKLFYTATAIVLCACIWYFARTTKPVDTAPIAVDPVVADICENIEVPKLARQSNKKPIKVEAPKPTKAVFGSTNNQFKSLLAVADSAKDLCNCFLKEIGGHSQAIINSSFNVDGSMVSTIGKDDMLRCSVYNMNTTRQMIEYHCIPSSVHYDKHFDVSLVTDVALTTNNKRILMAYDHSIIYYKVPVVDHGGDSKQKITYMKHFDCTHTEGLDKGKTAVKSIRIHTLHVMDVEKWMVVVISGDVDVTTPVYSVKQRENVLTSVVCPIVKVYNHTNHEIFCNMPTVKSVLMDTTNRKKSEKPKHTVKYHHKVSKIEVACTPNNKYIAVAGAGSMDENSWVDIQGLLSSDIGVYSINRASVGEATSLSLVYILPNHIYPVTCLSWSYHSSTLVSLGTPDISTLSPSVPGTGSEVGVYYIWELINENTASAATTTMHTTIQAHHEDTVHAIHPNATKLQTFPNMILRSSAAANTSIQDIELPVAIALLRRDALDMLSTIVVYAIHTSIYFIHRDTKACLRVLKQITTCPIRSIQLTMNGLEFATTVIPAKRIPVWRYINE